MALIFALLFFCAAYFLLPGPLFLASVLEFCVWTIAIKFIAPLIIKKPVSLSDSFKTSLYLVGYLVIGLIVYLIVAVTFQSSSGVTLMIAVWSGILLLQAVSLSKGLSCSISAGFALSIMLTLLALVIAWLMGDSLNATLEAMVTGAN